MPQSIRTPIYLILYQVHSPISTKISMQFFSLVASSIVVIFAGTIHIFHDAINIYFMGFFRDLARIKARKRRMRNSMAISATSIDDRMTKSDLKMLFFKQEDEDPLADIQMDFDIDENGKLKVKQVVNGSNEVEPSSFSDIDLAEYTREELFELGNGDNEEYVILISLYGRVYDVSEGYKYYGKGAKYQKFAGRDVTRALSTACMSDSCLGPKSSSLKESEDYFELTPKTIAEGKKWLSFFETHDSYHLVGILKDGQSLDELVDEQIQMEEKELN